MSPRNAPPRKVSRRVAGVPLAPDGSPAAGSDDASGYFAAFDWVAEETGIYRLQVTSFESVITGVLMVKRGN